MASPDIFTDRSDDKEPVIKPKKYASTQIVHDLIRSIFDSKDMKTASDRAKRVLRNIRNLNKKSAYFEVEYTELKELELELMDLRRFHKMGVNEMEIFLYSTKILTFFVWMIAFLIFLYCYRKDEPIDSDEIMDSIYVLLAPELIRILLCIFPFFRYCLVHDGKPDKVPTVDFKKMKKEKKAEEVSEEMMKEQIRIIDLHSEEVLPLKRKYCQLGKRQMGYKLAGILTIYLYVFICWLCFRERRAAGSSMDGHKMIGTVLMISCMIPFHLLGLVGSCIPRFYG